MKIDGGTFLVAGGSSGLGAACVRRLSRRGARVVIADVDLSGGDLAVEFGENALFVRADVTDEESLKQALSSALDRFGGLDGAIACAGVLGTDKVLTRDGVGSLTNFHRVIEINLVGTFNVVRLVADVLRSRPSLEDGERGVIVMTSSIAAFEGQIGQAAYAASKAGVAAMTLPIARELARYGIRLMTIAPGVFETPMMAEVPEQLRRSLIEQIPFPARFGDPDEFAALVEHVIENRMLNGSVIRLDGAMRMSLK